MLVRHAASVTFAQAESKRQAFVPHESYMAHKTNVTEQRPGQFSGDPGRARTCDLPLRRRLLYPAELRGRSLDASPLSAKPFPLNESRDQAASV